jgi:hypothetical protein
MPIMSGPAIIICGFAVTIGICFEVARRRRLAPILTRKCAGREWLQRFPNASANDVPEFLKITVDAFALPKKSYLAFRPTDQIMDIYLAIYPPKWTAADAMELEMFDQLLRRRYALALDKVWRNDVTLGEVFGGTGSV